MAAAHTISLSRPEPGIVVLSLDNPDKSANVLSTAVLEELEQALGEIEKDDQLQGLVIASGKPAMFIAGADLREFAASLDIPTEQTVAMCRRGQLLFGRLAQLPLVSVAAIGGICVGGGAELACWCDRRVMADISKAEIGFPEVRLGLFPGWGGTVRLPRMIGLANAVEMITSGESISARSAYAMGLADDVTDADGLVAAAIRLIRLEQASGKYLRDRQQWAGPIKVNETELGFLGITASAVIRQQTKGNYPAPDAALEVLMEGAMLDADTALQREAESMAELFGSPVNASLLNVFFLNDRVEKDRGVDAINIVPSEIRHVGVVGAGIMGSGIAAANVKQQLHVAICDASEESLASGVSQILEEVSYNKATKSTDAERMKQFAPLLQSCQQASELADADLVIEAIIENEDAKKALYAALEGSLADDSLLASNTSTIPITRLAADLQRPDRFCGIHFFNPVRRMQLVEVIRGDKTSDATVATAVAYAKQIRKLPIVVRDGPGFLVNRLLFPYMNESLNLLSAGVAVDDVERSAKKFGMPMGPITLYDVVGLDTALYAGRVMWEAFPDRITASPLLPAMVKAGRLGQKSGSGFFKYGGKSSRGAVDPEFVEFFKPYVQESTEMSREQITHRLFLPMLLEATRVLQDGLVRNVRNVDLGLIFGLGFPPFRGGLLFWADSIGAAAIVEMLKPYEELGERFHATELLRELAASGKRFYDL